VFLEECKDPKACTILLRGGSKDFLNEVERNLQDAMQVARNVVFEPKLLPGGGATEMAISVGPFVCQPVCAIASGNLTFLFSLSWFPGLSARAKTIEGVADWPYKAVGQAFEVIPRTLAQNCGADTVRLLTELRVRRCGCQ
jgi:T-complex protein 1 subunit gamma